MSEGIAALILVNFNYPCFDENILFNFEGFGFGHKFANSVNTSVFAEDCVCSSFLSMVDTTLFLSINKSSN